jgi:hypothetical protein
MWGGTWLFDSHYAFPNHLSEHSQSVCTVRDDVQEVFVINPFEEMRFEKERKGILSETRIFGNRSYILQSIVWISNYTDVIIIIIIIQFN